VKKWLENKKELPGKNPGSFRSALNITQPKQLTLDLDAEDIFHTKGV